MNPFTATQKGLSNVIAQLQKQKDELTNAYHTAITNGEKLHEVKTMYLSIKDLDRKLNDLLRITFIDNYNDSQSETSAFFS
jgi:hypothetical protein